MVGLRVLQVMRRDETMEVLGGAYVLKMLFLAYFPEGKTRIG
jgi:hypothetical protein